MTHDKTGGPAFPCMGVKDGYGRVQGGQKGMTFRQYAAIKLRVPESGTDWLDDMIRQAKRDEFAGQALAGIETWMPASGGSDLGAKRAMDARALWAYEQADAMLREREGNGND